MWCFCLEKRSSSAQATTSPSRISAAELSPMVVRPRMYMDPTSSCGSALRARKQQRRVDAHLVAASYELADRGEDEEKHEDLRALPEARPDIAMDQRVR